MQGDDDVLGRAINWTTSPPTHSLLASIQLRTVWPKSSDAFLQDHLVAASGGSKDPDVVISTLSIPSYRIMGKAAPFVKKGRHVVTAYITPTSDPFIVRIQTVQLSGNSLLPVVVKWSAGSRLDAYICAAWPDVARRFTVRHRKSMFPSLEVIEAVLETRCLIVPHTNDVQLWRYDFSGCFRVVLHALPMPLRYAFEVFKRLVTFVGIPFLDDYFTHAFLFAVEDWREGYFDNVGICLSALLVRIQHCLMRGFLPDYFTERNLCADLGMPDVDSRRAATAAVVQLRRGLLSLVASLSRVCPEDESLCGEKFHSSFRGLNDSLVAKGSAAPSSHQYKVLLSLLTTEMRELFRSRRFQSAMALCAEIYVLLSKVKTQTSFISLLDSEAWDLAVSDRHLAAELYRFVLANFQFSSDVEARLLQNLGCVSMIRDSAERSLLDAFALRPEDSSVIADLGAHYVRYGKFHRAVAMFNKVLLIDDLTSINNIFVYNLPNEMAQAVQRDDKFCKEVELPSMLYAGLLLVVCHEKLGKPVTKLRETVFMIAGARLEGPVNSLLDFVNTV